VAKGGSTWRLPKCRAGGDTGTGKSAGFQADPRTPRRDPGEFGYQLLLNPTSAPKLEERGWAEGESSTLRCTLNWTATTVRVTLPRMTIILILAIALLVGASVQNRWVLLLPLGIGAFTALGMAGTGRGLGDTPIPFLVIVCTLVMIGGQGLRSRNVSSMS
jgi:hypothetical protein